MEGNFKEESDPWSKPLKKIQTQNRKKKTFENIPRPPKYENDHLEKIKQEIKTEEQAIIQLMYSIQAQKDRALKIKTELENLEKQEVRIKEAKKELEKEKEIIELKLIEYKYLLEAQEDVIKQKFSLNAANKPIENEKLCVICLNKKANHALVPCGHMSYCGECCQTLKICGICRKDSNSFIQIFD